MQVKVIRMFFINIRKELSNGRLKYYNLYDLYTNSEEHKGGIFLISGQINGKNISANAKYLGSRKFRLVELRSPSILEVSNNDIIVFSCYHLRESIFKTDNRLLPITLTVNGNNSRNLLSHFNFNPIGENEFEFDFSKFEELLLSNEYVSYLNDRKHYISKTCKSALQDSITLTFTNRWKYSFLSDDEVASYIKENKYSPTTSKYILGGIKDIISNKDIILLEQRTSTPKYDNTKLIIQLENPISPLLRLVSSYDDETNQEVNNTISNKSK